MLGLDLPDQLPDSVSLLSHRMHRLTSPFALLQAVGWDAADKSNSVMAMAIPLGSQCHCLSVLLHA